jgi:apolipoprotein N-acyltransferase
LRTVSTAKNTLALSLFGLAGGLISSMAYPDNSIWVAIFPATALMLYAISSSSAKQSLVVGLVTGFTFYASQIPWMTVYLGPVPWLALSTLEAIIFAVGAWAINRFFRTRRTQAPIITAAGVAILWVAREWLACNFPYGGFPWSRLALSQSNSPLANWVYWGGISWLSFIIVFATVLVMLTWTSKLRPAYWPTSPVALILVLIFLVPQLTPTSTKSKADTIDVAAVQGNANAGLFANPKPGSILKNHLDASKQLLATKQKPDVLIWPENAADQNPLNQGLAKTQVRNFVDEVNAPVIFGTITSRGQNIYNSSILWLPNIGPVDWYDKKRPVAFGEFVPDREFFRLLAPDLIDLIPRGYSFGTRDGIFELPKLDTKLGTMICFEVAVDDITRDLVQQGAELLVVQTNNSDFGTTNESAQQLAIAKLRAIEGGRVVVNISTVGLSAIVLPSGEVIDSLEAYKPGLMRQHLELLVDKTPAMLFGGSIDLIINFAALGIILSTIRRRGRS